MGEPAGSAAQHGLDAEEPDEVELLEERPGDLEAVPPKHVEVLVDPVRDERLLERLPLTRDLSAPSGIRTRATALKGP